MVLLTLVIGIIAYFAICWIRALQQRKPHSDRPDKTLFDVAYDDFQSILMLFGMETKQESNGEKQMKPVLRRGSSASNLKDIAEKKKNELVRRKSSRMASYNCML